MPYNPLSNHPSSNLVEFIKGKLYFTWSSQELAQRNIQCPDSHYFTVDNVFIYIAFFSDFGPPNVAHLVRFCHMLDNKLKDPCLHHKKIHLYSGMDFDKRANAAFLMCAYMVIMQKKLPEEAFKPLVGISPPFMPFRDAGHGPSTYHITILDCLKGLHKAMVRRLFKLDEFNLPEYEYHEKVENGDFNWITDKFIAFASPQDEYVFKQSTLQQQQMFLQRQAATNFGIKEMIKYFKDNGVTTVIRLNNKLYDRKKFLDAGIEHIEMYFQDGSNPPETILKKFLEICETRPGTIAVHCKAGLGRTGSLIAAYFMKHYRFTASEIIGFLRVIRPGSVVGPQQNWLQANQAQFWKLGHTPASPTKTDDEMDVDSVDVYSIPMQPRKGPEAQFQKVQSRTQIEYPGAISDATSNSFFSQNSRYNLRSYTTASSSTSTASVAASVQQGTYPKSTALRFLIRQEKRSVSGVPKIRSGNLVNDTVVDDANSKKKHATVVSGAVHKKRPAFGV